MGDRKKCIYLGMLMERSLKIINTIRGLDHKSLSLKIKLINVELRSLALMAVVYG